MTEQSSDMSEAHRSAAARTHAVSAATAENERWHDLVSQVGSEIAAPLTAALERIHLLTATGKIDRAGLRALRDEVEQARQLGMIGQQLTRFASGRVRQSHEVLQLEEVMKSVLALRSRETQARGIALKPQLKSARVIVDGSLLFSLLNATLDWALANAHAHIEFTIDFKTWPAHARLTCRFAHRPADQPDESVTAAVQPCLDSLHWRLIEQTAWTMGLIVERKDVAGITTLVLEFPKTAGEEMEGLSASEIDDASSQSGNSKALAGSHVLVVASRREVRVLIRDALRNMSMLVDFVNSVDEAASFCKEGLPHAIIIESIQRGERFASFRDEILAEVPDFVFIEILEQGSTFEMSGTNGAAMARIGRDVVLTSLPAALMFELSRSL
jgi:CheY-like chemotaxis protein